MVSAPIITHTLQNAIFSDALRVWHQSKFVKIRNHSHLRINRAITQKNQRKTTSQYLLNLCVLVYWWWKFALETLTTSEFLITIFKNIAQMHSRFNSKKFWLSTFKLSFSMLLKVGSFWHSVESEGPVVLNIVVLNYVSVTSYLLCTIEHQVECGQKRDCPNLVPQVDFDVMAVKLCYIEL